MIVGGSMLYIQSLLDEWAFPATDPEVRARWEDRLAEIGVWLRRTTLDDIGVRLPMTVRVPDYAATGPHIAGMDFGNQPAASPGGPHIGIDFAAAIDTVAPSPAAAGAAATAASGR